MKIAIVLGTRPEIIKMSPIIRYCQKNNNFFLIHTGQHYSYNMDQKFFEELELEQPKYHLEIGSGLHGWQKGEMLKKIEPILIEEKPDVLLVQGDTNSVLAGALEASKLPIKVGHVEACLRSYDKTMPEEINRILTDHISDFLFAPTNDAKEKGLKENIPEHKIFVTGNTIVDAVFQNIELAKTDILQKIGIKKNEYILLTLHRQENVDNENKLKNIFLGIEQLSNKLNLKVLYPIHPRTKKMIENFSLKIPNNITLLEPLSFLEFLNLEKNAKLILTDSGGVQEEACILKVPCVTLRENTERPETVEIGSNILAGTDPEKIVQCGQKMINSPKIWDNPFGDGKTTERIMRIIETQIHKL